MEPQYLTRREFADRLKLSLRTVDNLIAQGKVSYWQVGNSGAIRIPAIELERHLKGPPDAKNCK
jgi:excisionase family DNA binding protein